jgi:Ulp1 family protease
MQLSMVIMTWNCISSPEEELPTNQLLNNSGNIIGAYSSTTIGFGIIQTLTLGKLESLRPGLWLNDECINSYMALLNTRDLTRATALGARRWYCYTTFFMTKLLQTGSPWEGQAETTKL